MLAVEIYTVLVSSILAFILGVFIGGSLGYMYWGTRR